MTDAQIDAPSIGQRVGELAKKIPTIQWMRIRARYGFGIESVGGQPEGLFLVVANELHRQEFGANAWDRFEETPMPELVDYITTHGAGAAGDDADKSD
jgi:hypothetical protein